VFQPSGVFLPSGGPGLCCFSFLVFFGRQAVLFLLLTDPLFFLRPRRGSSLDRPLSLFHEAVFGLDHPLFAPFRVADPCFFPSFLPPLVRLNKQGSRTRVLDLQSPLVHQLSPVPIYVFARVVLRWPCSKPLPLPSP